ncbi:LssY C-terminal domain-containing protein, partial [Streptomyces galilaeus]|uniref:LssY C-terminal domain-containing protein n=1 Tax=Streptomyces galilaeus TaxID=33899 RepID=UPI0038F7135B
NLAFQGERAQVEAAMAAAGWIPADPGGLGSSWRIIVSTLRRRSYPTAPVSPLFLFGRMQDLAYQQEVAGSPAQRHHVRLWRCPDGWL